MVPEIGKSPWLKKGLAPFVCAVAASFLCSISVIADSTAQLSGEQQDRYEKVCKSLLAPCCWSEPVAVHRSTEALQLREQIAQLVAAGKSEREILDGFIQQYGQKILIVPEGRKAKWLYWVPALVLVGGVLAALRFLLTHQRLRSDVQGGG